VELLDFTRKWVLHGTPFIFENREDQFYDFGVLGTGVQEFWRSSGDSIFNYLS
jgi:hypothetical protein